MRRRLRPQNTSSTTLVLCVAFLCLDTVCGQSACSIGEAGNGLSQNWSGRGRSKGVGSQEDHGSELWDAAVHASTRYVATSIARGLSSYLKHDVLLRRWLRHLLAAPQSTRISHNNATSYGQSLLTRSLGRGRIGTMALLIVHDPALASMLLPPAPLPVHAQDAPPGSLREAVYHLFTNGELHRLESTQVLQPDVNPAIAFLETKEELREAANSDSAKAADLSSIGGTPNAHVVESDDFDEEGADACVQGEEWDGAECVACVEGYYKESSGAGQCVPCTGCDAGMEKRGCGESSAGQCTECSVGKFNPEATNEDSDVDPGRLLEVGCRECEDCPLGFFRSGCGVALPGTCEPCITDEQCMGMTPAHFATECLPTMNGYCEPCKTAEGQCYDPNSMTAASNAHPKPSPERAAVMGFLEDETGGYTIPTSFDGPPLPEWMKAADPSMPWYLSHLKMHIHVEPSCESEGIQGGSCRRCTRCAMWMHIWLPGECGTIHDEECFTDVLRCGTKPHRIMTLVLILVFAVWNVNKVMRPIMAHLQELASDIAGQAIIILKVLTVLSVGMLLISIFRALGVDMPEDTEKHYQYMNTTRHFIVDRLSHLHHRDQAFDNMENLSWTTVVFMAFTAFFFYCVIRLWINGLLDDLCVQWSNSLFYVTFLILQIAVIFETSCITAFNVLEDLAGIYWFCVSLFVFGRLLGTGRNKYIEDNESGKIKCFATRVVPRMFLLMLAFFIPYAASVTLNYGRYNVVAKFAILCLLLLGFAYARKIKSAVLGHYCDLGGPRCVECGVWQPARAGSTGRRGGWSLRKEIQCQSPKSDGEFLQFGKFQDSEAASKAVCKCTKRSGKLGTGPIGFNQHCEDLKGKNSPCFFEGCSMTCD